MFRILRYCKCGLIAGLIGMIAGMAGQIYIYEVSDRNAALMQAASVFKALDEIAFVVAFFSACVFVYFCTFVEYRRWCRKKQQNSNFEG